MFFKPLLKLAGVSKFEPLNNITDYMSSIVPEAGICGM